MKFLLPYQAAYIKDDARYRIYEKSRRIGITFAEAAWSHQRRLLCKHDHIFSSSDYKTGLEFIGYIKKFCEATNLQVKQQYGIDEYIKLSSATSECVTYPNGARIMIVSSSPNSFRGNSADVSLDEFAFHDQQENLFRAASPCAEWGEGHVHVISTHNGSGTVFNEMLKKAKNKILPFKHYRTTLNDAVDQGLAEKIKGYHSKLPTKQERGKAYMDSVQAKCLNDAMWKQEFCCEVLSSASMVPPEFYEKCILPNFTVSRDTYRATLVPGSLFIGIDPARALNGDNCVVWVIERGLDKSQTNPRLQVIYRTLLVRTMNGVPFATQYEIMSNLIAHPKVQKVCIEQNGLGYALAEQLVAKFPGKVEAFNTNAKSKQLCVERLSGWIQQERISMPKDDDIKQDIMAMQRNTDKKTITYEGRTADGHCDHYMAASLSLQAAEGENEFFEFGWASDANLTQGHVLHNAEKET